MLTEAELLVLATAAHDRACETREWCVTTGAAKDVLRAATETKSASARLLTEIRERLELDEVQLCV